jgi:hypothetical protein
VDYKYHTHPFENGQTVEENGGEIFTMDDPNTPSQTDLNAAGSGDELIITRTQIIVLSGGKDNCRIAR